MVNASDNWERDTSGKYSLDMTPPRVSGGITESLRRGADILQPQGYTVKPSREDAEEGFSEL